MNSIQAVQFAIENGVEVEENKRDTHYEWVKLIKGNDVVTVQRLLKDRGKCWGIYGQVNKSNYNYREFHDLRLGVAIERAVEVLIGAYA